MSDTLSNAELNDVETVLDGLTYHSLRPGEDGRTTFFATDVWFLVRYVNTLRADALLASDKAVALTVEYENRLHDARAAALEEAEKKVEELAIAVSNDIAVATYSNSYTGKLKATRSKLHEAMAAIRALAGKDAE